MNSFLLTLDQTGGLQKNWDKVKRAPKTDSVGAAAMFLVILEGMVYTVGAIFAAAALYLGMRYYKGQSMPCVNVFDSELSAKVCYYSYIYILKVFAILNAILYMII